MLLWGKLSDYFKAQKHFYLGLLAVCFLGFLAGCFYSNLISDTDFANAGIQAEEFIRQAKEHELSFHLIVSEELSPVLFIAAFSMFLPGFLPILFLVFKWGYSASFFMTFLVRYFSMKGFFLGGFFLLTNLFIFLPAMMIVSVKSIKTNCFFLASVSGRATRNFSVWGELSGLAVTTLAAILLIAVGTAIKILLLPPLCNYLFL